MICAYLDQQTNLCLIYETRPAVCRFGTKKPPTQSMDEYVVDVAAGCDILQEREGMPKEYRVTPRLRRPRPQRW